MFENYVFEPARTPEDGKRIVFDISPHDIGAPVRRVVSKPIELALIADTLQKLRNLGHRPVCVVNCRRLGKKP